MISGKPPTKCNSYIEKYFGIVAYKHGDFSPDRTLKARANFLNQCKGGDNNTNNKVNDKYGKSRGL